MSNNLKHITSKIAFASLLAISSNLVQAQNTLSFPLIENKKITDEFLKQYIEIDFFQLENKGGFSIEKNNFNLKLKSDKNKIDVDIEQKGNSEIPFVMITGNVYRFFKKYNGKLTEIHLSANFTISKWFERCTNKPQLLLNWKYISTVVKEHFSHGHYSHCSSNPK